MFIRILAVVLSLAAAACGGPTTFSCNLPSMHQCSTISVVGGTLTSTTCSGTVVDSCPTAGVLGRCTIVMAVTGVANATQTSVADYYAGANLPQAQAGCTGAMGTWTTP